MRFYVGHTTSLVDPGLHNIINCNYETANNRASKHSGQWYTGSHHELK